MRLQEQRAEGRGQGINKKFKNNKVRLPISAGIVITRGQQFSSGGEDKPGMEGGPTPM